MCGCEWPPRAATTRMERAACCHGRTPPPQAMLARPHGNKRLPFLASPPMSSRKARSPSGFTPTCVRESRAHLARTTKKKDAALYNTVTTEKFKSMHLSEKEKVLRRTDKQQSKLWDALEKEKMKGEHITGGLHDYWEPGASTSSVHTPEQKKKSKRKRANSFTPSPDSKLSPDNPGRDGSRPSLAECFDITPPRGRRVVVN